MESSGGTGVQLFNFSALLSLSLMSFIPPGHAVVGASRSAAGLSLLRAVVQHFPPGKSLPWTMAYGEESRTLSPSAESYPQKEGHRV